MVVKNAPVSSLLLEELKPSEVDKWFFIGAIIVLGRTLHGRPFEDTPSPCLHYSLHQE
jgi:hypothetical protein